MTIFARFKHAMSQSFSGTLFQFCLISLFGVLGLQVQGQTVILSNAGFSQTGTDAITTDAFNVGVGNCTSISFSLNFEFSLPWAGSGNLESNDECPFAPEPCAGDPTPGIGDAEPCANCWDFLYVRYQVDGVTVFSRLIGVPGDLSQNGTINFGPICTQNVTNASIIINTQTWGSNETVTVSNLTITCWDASATLTANPNPACASQPISLTGNLTNPSSVSSQVWTGTGTIANPTLLNTTATTMPLGINIYTLTTTDDNNCTETSTASVDVTPGIIANNPSPQVFNAGQLVPLIPLTGTATTYNWVNSNTDIGLGANGTGDIPSFTAANVAVTTTGTITVTPSSIGCTGTPITFPITITPPPPEMVFVQGGTFTMGCTAEQQPDCYPDESPAHQVTLTDFYMGKYEVTQEQWESLMGYTQAQMRDLANPAWPLSGVGSTYPIYYVSWYDAAVFCNRLSEQQGYTACYYADAGYTQIYGKSGSTWSLPNTGTVYWKPDVKGYRLPTEAEWEYAARGGNMSMGYKYAGSNDVNAVAWYSANSGNTTHTVGTKAANELGLYDMSGNVWERCYDWYSGSYYGSSPACTPLGSGLGEDRVRRGGSWFNAALLCRSAYRNFGTPAVRNYTLGFRLVLQ